MTRVPLAVLDLIPVSSGATNADAVRNTLDLAQRAETFGYRRYWLAEHHLNPGVIGSSPAVAMALVAGVTDSIRLGSAAFQLGHRTALSVLEDVGLVDALHPGRIDVGLGRAPGPPKSSGGKPVAAQAAPTPAPVADTALVVPPKFDPSRLLASPRLGLSKHLLLLPGAESHDYGEQVDELLALLAGTYSHDGVAGQAAPGEGADVEVWVFGSTAGVSAEVAGRRALRFGANYHVAPAGVLEAVAAYRAAFVPSEQLAAPYVSVSADVVVAEDDETAAELAAGYAPWVHSIRTGSGAIPFPTPHQARELQSSWDDDDRALVQDRLDTQLVGSPPTVVARLEELQAATGADELLITTITHDHADRVRSYELLAKEWVG